MTTVTIDEQKLERFVFRAVREVGAALNAVGSQAGQARIREVVTAGGFSRSASRRRPRSTPSTKRGRSAAARSQQEE